MDSSTTSSDITQAEQQFVLALIREAASLGLTEVEYKSLKVRISPNAARESAKRGVQFTSGNWSAPPIAKAGNP